MTFLQAHMISYVCLQFPESLSRQSPTPIAQADWREAPERFYFDEFRQTNICKYFLF